MSLLRINRPHWTDRKPTRPDLEWDIGHAREYGLVGAWVLNSPMIVRDLSEVGNDAVQVGATPKPVATPHGMGYDFSSGTNNHRLSLGAIGATNPLNLNADSPAQNQATCLAHLRLNNTGTFPRIIDKSDGGNGANGWAFMCDDRAGNKQIAFGKEGSYGESSGTYTNGVWMTIGVTYEAILATECEFFLDGASNGTGAHTSANTFETTETSAAIGQWNHDTTDRHFDGEIDYVYVFNTVLPDAEIAALTREPYRYCRLRSRRVVFIPGAAAPAAGRGVGPLAGVGGGLAGRGGLAGSRGGLAA